MSQARSVARRTVAPRTAGAGATSPRLGLALLVIATAQLMVLLDATIVNVALPHIQHALGFSGSGLEWVVNAYALSFGGLLLLAGRAGDLLGRRKVFIAGLLLFSAASLAGGFATCQAWLLAARTGANLIMLCVGAATFGMFFFLTLFLQSVWGYPALKTGLAYLPLTAGIMVSSGAAAQLIPRVGVRPLLLAGAPAAAGGLYWLSRLGEHGSYAGAVLGPMLVIAAGLGLLFVPLTLVAMSKVADAESGVAASLRNTGQQVGGSIGLAVLGTVAWTVVANSNHAQTTRATATAARRGPASQRSPRSTTTPWPPGSPAPSWSPPASCCSPWSSPWRPSGSGAPTSAAPALNRRVTGPRPAARKSDSEEKHETHDHRGRRPRRPGTSGTGRRRRSRPHRRDRRPGQLSRPVRTVTADIEDILAGSGLDWTVIRPPQLTGKPLTGTYRTTYGQNIRSGLSVPRADAAHLMLRVVGQPQTIHQAIGIAS